MKNFSILQDTVTIKILGQEYKVQADGNREHVQSLSRYINDKVLDVQQKGNAVSTMELITVVMLSMADDVSQARLELDEFKVSTDKTISRLIEMIDVRNENP